MAERINGAPELRPDTKVQWTFGLRVVYPRVTKGLVSRPGPV